MDRCTAHHNAEYRTSKGLDYIHKIVKSSTEPTSISSIGLFRCCFVTIHNNYYESHYGSTKKGHTFTLSVMAVDQVRNPQQFTVLLSVRVDMIVSKKDGQNKKLAISAQN